MTKLCTGNSTRTLFRKCSVSEHTLLSSPQATQKHASFVQNNLCFDRQDCLLTSKVERSHAHCSLVFTQEPVVFRPCGRMQLKGECLWGRVERSGECSEFRQGKKKRKTPAVSGCHINAYQRCTTLLSYFKTSFKKSFRKEHVTVQFLSDVLMQ